MKTASFFAPGFDEQVEQQNIEQQRKMAQALMQQSQEALPNGQMVGNHFVPTAPTQGLAQMLKAYYGRKDLTEASDRQKALAEAVKGRADAAEQQSVAEWGKVAPLLTGREADVLTEDQAGPVRAAQAPDLRGAYAQAMQSQDPSLQQFGMSGMAKLPEMEAAHQERVDARAFRQQEAEAARVARAEELRVRMEDARTSQAERLAAQKELRQMQIDAQRDTQRLIAANRPERQAQIIQTADGPAQLVNGRAVPILGADGKPVASAKSATAAPQTRERDAKDAIATIDMAEKLIDEATGSGIGNAVDATLGFFGKSTDGAKAAARLKALEGDLVSKMPKMSGPQSDKDVLLYRQMAGQIGDPNVPRETKKAALLSIREMQNRYAGLPAEGSWDTPAPAAPTAAPSVRGGPMQKPVKPASVSNW